MRVLAASGFHDSREQASADAEPTAFGMDDNLARSSTLVARGEREGVGVAGEALAIEGEDRVGMVVAALDAQELVLAEGLVAVGEGGGADERLQFG